MKIEKFIAQIRKWVEERKTKPELPPPVCPPGISSERWQAMLRWAIQREQNNEPLVFGFTIQ
jgi:hypothetical protein